MNATMNDATLERWRKEIKAAIRYEFIDGIVMLCSDLIKQSITVEIKYTEDDHRNQAKEEIRLETLRKESKDCTIDWKKVLAQMIQKYGKNREVETKISIEQPKPPKTMNYGRIEDYIPTVVDVAPDAETVVDHGQDGNARKVKKVARFDEWKEAR